MELNNIYELITRGVQRYSQLPALVHKSEGQWHKISWDELKTRVHQIAQGLIGLGLNKSNTVCLLSHTRVEWTMIDLGILANGGITVPIYPSSVPSQCEFIINDSEARFIFVENKEQLDKILEIKDRTPNLMKIITITEGMPGSSLVMTLEELIELGSNKHEEELAKRISDLQLSDIATFVYTSGTTGVPKGTVHTHESFLAGVYGSTKSLPSLEDLETINFLPLSHVLGRENSFIHMYSGTVQWYAESFEKLGENIREARPHFFSAVPRVFEKAFNKISDKVEKKGPQAVRLFNWSVKVGREVSQHLQKKERIPFNLKWKYLVAKALVFNKIRKGFGGRLDFVVCGGAPLSQKLAELFHAVGVLILEGYGLTETCSATHVNQMDHFKFGTVGLPIGGIEVKLAEDNEILVRGKSIMLGYYKNEKLTQEALSSEGWYHTEDIGEIDSEGFLKIVDRKKDLIVTSGGKNVAPQYIENLLKSSYYISECLVYGDRRSFLTALIVPDEERTRAWAQKNSLNHKTFDALIRKKEIIQLIEKEIELVGQNTASYQRVKKFVLLDKEFSEAAGEITPSLKLKRPVIIKKHQKLLDQLYKDRYN